jgi:hypothetical protein
MILFFPLNTCFYARAQYSPRTLSVASFDSTQCRSWWMTREWIVVHRILYMIELRDINLHLPLLREVCSMRRVRAGKLFMTTLSYLELDLKDARLPDIMLWHD